MASDFQTLQKDMRACTLCTDLPFESRPIFQLRPQVKILIAGQAPGRITHEKGRPFDDPSGDRLRNWLAVNKETFYNDPRIGMFPMGLCFPGSGKGGDKPPPPICAKTWRRPVLDSLLNVELTLILGSYAIAWHLPQYKKDSVANAVKAAAKEKNNTYILPHPSPRNNRWLKQNAWFEEQIIPRIQQDVSRILSDS